MNNQEIVASALESIYTEKGELSPRGVVTEAAKASHPLHRFFEWDNSEAADKYRLNQARDLIRSVRVRFVTEEESGEVRAWHAARRMEMSDREGYIPDGEVRDNPVASAALLRSMEREWLNMRRRWGHQRSFWGLVRQDIPNGEVDTVGTGTVAQGSSA